jgi:HAD superfamily hydrolase (TIGR01484 family)
MRYLALATDYDGTIAHHGLVESATIDAFQQLKESGRKLILVTGREIPDLCNVFSEPRIFDLIVAENGALLHNPASKHEKLLAQTPPKEFSHLLLEQGVHQMSVGRVIVATQESYAAIVRKTIQELNLNLQVILNKGSLMVLPLGVNKGTGLKAALAELHLEANQVVGVGDAENDHALFDACGYSVAVANALPELKRRAHWVTLGDHGKGVRELIRRMLEGSELNAIDSQPSSGSFESANG